MEDHSESRRLPIRALLVLGALLGGATAGGASLISGDLDGSPTVRVPASVVLRGQVPDAMRYAAREAQRIRSRAGQLAWPPAPLRIPGRPPLADEGVFFSLPGPAPLAVSWIHLPGGGEATMRVTTWPTERLALLPWNGDADGVVAWVQAPPAGALVDEVLTATGLSAAQASAALPRSAVDGGKDAAALCVDGDGRAMLFHGRTRDMGAVAALLRELSCDAPGVMWRTPEGQMRLVAGAPAPGAEAWVLRERPRLASAPR